MRDQFERNINYMRVSVTDLMQSALCVLHAERGNSDRFLTMRSLRLMRSQGCAGSGQNLGFPGSS